MADELRLSIQLGNDPAQQIVDMLRQASERIPQGLASLRFDGAMVRKLFTLSPQATDEGTAMTLAPSVIGAELAATMKDLERCLIKLGALAPLKPAAPVALAKTRTRKR